MIKFSIFTLFILFSANALGVCNLEDSKVKDMLDRLKIEVLCSTEDSLASCATLLQSFVTNKDFLSVKMPESTCSLTSSITRPEMVLTSSLIKILNQESTEGRLINSLEGFYDHTEKHRARVKVLGRELYKTHPHLFEGLQEFQLEKILDAHDEAKVNPKIRAGDGRPLYEVLYDEGFGKQIDHAIVDNLNINDKKIMMEVRDSLGLQNKPDLLTKAWRVEKVADLVDRGMSPAAAEEFGRPMQKASSFISNLEDRELARFLESRYATLTKDLQFRRLTPLQSSAMKARLYLNKRFASALIHYSAEQLSSFTLVGDALRGAQKIGNAIFKVISSQGLATAMRRLNAPMLYFSEIKSTACSEVGYHDWVKDPNCRPAIGLTPRLIEFLNEDWETQKMHLKIDRHTCEVIRKTYDQSIQAPQLTQCRAQSVEFKNINGDKIEAHFDAEKKLTDVEIKKSTLLNKLYPRGAPRTVKLRSDGSVDQVCTSKKCVASDSRAATDSVAFVHAMNYQIQKAIHCCQPANGFLETRCQK